MECFFCLQPVLQYVLAYLQLKPMLLPLLMLLFEVAGLLEV